MHLLLVEDDQTLIAELKPALQRSGYAVEVAIDGVDGEFAHGCRAGQGTVTDREPVLAAMKCILRGSGCPESVPSSIWRACHVSTRTGPTASDTCFSACIFRFIFRICRSIIRIETFEFSTPEKGVTVRLSAKGT